MVDTNKKLPKHAWDDDEIQTEQGWVTGEQDILGSKNFKYANPDKPDDFSIQEVLATGSYRTIQFDKNKKQITTNFDIGQNHAYVAGGKSTHVDGHININGESTIATNSTGDNGETSKTKFVGATDKLVAIVEGSTFNSTVPLTGLPGSTKSFTTTFGDNVQEHGGNWHEGFERDHVSGISGNKITMVGKDYAVHVQKGNYDMQIAQRGRMFSTGPLLIESATLLTLKVGASTIIIGPASIRMISPRIDLN